MEQFYFEDKFSFRVIFHQFFFFSFFSRISRCVSSIVLRSRFNEAETRPKLFCGASIFSAFVSPTMCLYFSWYEDFDAEIGFSNKLASIRFIRSKLQCFSGIRPPLRGLKLKLTFATCLCFLSDSFCFTLFNGYWWCFVWFRRILVA